jgi:hypothetical protein
MDAPAEASWVHDTGSNADSVRGTDRGATTSYVSVSPKAIFAVDDADAVPVVVVPAASRTCSLSLNILLLCLAQKPVVPLAEAPQSVLPRTVLFSFDRSVTAIRNLQYPSAA